MKFEEEDIILKVGECLEARSLSLYYLSLYLPSSLTNVQYYLRELIILLKCDIEKVAFFKAAAYLVLEELSIPLSDFVCFL